MRGTVWTIFWLQGLIWRNNQDSQLQKLAKSITNHCDKLLVLAYSILRSKCFRSLLIFFHLIADFLCSRHGSPLVRRPQFWKPWSNSNASLSSLCRSNACGRFFNGTCAPTASETNALTRKSERQQVSLNTALISWLRVAKANLGSVSFRLTKKSKLRTYVRLGSSFDLLDLPWLLLRFPDQNKLRDAANLWTK